jgi:peptidoglycan/LPS O-acetylase OafA/YrhL
MQEYAALRILPKSVGSASERHLPELDGLRGIACSLVVLTHCLVGISEKLVEIRGVVFPFLVGGVDLFFVLSGFLIVGILLDNREAKNYFRVFWSRRILRIFPVYFLLLATYLAALALHTHLSFPALDVWLFKDPTLPAWSYALFIQNYFMAFENQTGSYWIGITWSLSIEEQFYLVVPLLVFILKRRQMLALALACIVVAPVLRFWPGADWHWFYFATPCRMDALMFGVAVTCAIRDRTIMNFFRKWRLAFDGLILALAAISLDTPLLHMDSRIRYSVLAAIFAYCILRIFLVEAGWNRALLRSRLLVQLGLISYPLYMYHQAVNGLVHGWLFGTAPAVRDFGGLAAAALVIGISVILATVSTRYFERPFRQKGRTMKYSYEPADGASKVQVGSAHT